MILTTVPETILVLAKNFHIQSYQRRLRLLQPMGPWMEERISHSSPSRRRSTLEDLLWCQYLNVYNGEVLCPGLVGGRGHEERSYLRE